MKLQGQGIAGLRLPERESAFIVKNTFLEVPEEEKNDSSEEDSSPFPFRRRRGSSFYRSASEPRFPQRIEAPILEAHANFASRCDDVEDQDDASPVGAGLISHDVSFEHWPSRWTPVGDKLQEVESQLPVQQSSAHMPQQPHSGTSQLAKAFAPVGVHQVAGMPQSGNSAVGWPTHMDSRSTWACQPPGTFAVNDTNALAAAMYAGFNAGMLAVLSANQGIPESVPSSDTNFHRKNPPSMQRSRHDHKPIQHAGRDYAAQRQCYGETAATGDGEHNRLFTRQLLVGSQGQQLDFDSKLSTPRTSLGSCASDISTAVSNGASSLHELRTPSPSPEPTGSSCHLIWCDQRAFKEASDSWKKQLEAATHIQVKTHKTSEKCIRLLKKKQHSQARPPCVFLVSWANAATLLPFLSQSPNITARVILLCDTDMCRGRNHDAAERLASCYQFVAHLADSWADAVVVASQLVEELQGTHLN